MVNRSNRFSNASRLGIAGAVIGLVYTISTPLQATTSVSDQDQVAAPLDYQRDVRPILSDHCFACHGPDEAKREADLRLDSSEGVHSVIEAGKPDQSELVSRLLADDETLMPPPEYGKPLSDIQKDTLRRWIEQGGQVQEHWAFEAPQKAVLPPDTKNPIDHFIDAKIRVAGLVGNSQASPSTLLRRVSLGLTGLPPTRQQIDRLHRDDFQYERLVDEMLATPAFGQHFGRYWLDLVRYADTHGLHLDNYREMWPYRDWVIDAINNDMPFDQFIIEQLAGDLLPDATQAQQIASGFNRLNVTTSEGGSIYEEVFARNVIDRTDSFGTIFLGLTTQCAVCHDHKFDPIRQKDYYSLSAFFNSLDGQALDGNKKDHPPVIRVPSEDQLAQLAEFDQQIVDLKLEMEGPIESVDAAQRSWEISISQQPDSETVVHSKALIPGSASEVSHESLTIDDEGIVISNRPANDKATLLVEIPLDESFMSHRWQTIVMDVLPDPESDRVGISSNGNAVLTEFGIDVMVGDEWKHVLITDAMADIEQDGDQFKVENAIDGKTDGQGWAVAGHQTKGSRKVQFRSLELSDRLAEQPSKLRFTLDFQSVYAKHQFHAMRFSLSDAPPQIGVDDQIKLGNAYLAGPFTVESESPGYSRVFVSEQRQFKPDEKFKYRDKELTWSERSDFSPVAVHSLPSESDAVNVNVLYQKLTSPKAQTVDLLLGTSDGHVIYLNNKRLQITKETGPLKPLSHSYRLELREGDNDLYIKSVSQSRPIQLTYAFRSPAIPAPMQIAELVSHPPDQRSEEQQQSIRTYYRKAVCEHPDWTAIEDMIAGLEKAKEEMNNDIPTTLVWKELATPRQAHILNRGQYDQPGEPVDRAVPEFLPAMVEGLPRDRLGLAKWLTSPDHPLASRVVVNRVWQWLFGVGLVKSSEDFGSQGEPPSHQALLDWLAVDFQQNGWDLKRLIKQMVMSDAYRRDSSIDQNQLAIDPKNRLLSRGPRYRLDAEVLRDQALSLAGLLNEQSSGPSVKPPQPDGLWYAVGYTRSNTANFKADKEIEKRLRRSVYIFWKRTSPPPQMSTFDAPSRESCTARRERTNTPLQALVLMNEHQYLKASKHLAIRAFNDTDAAPDEERLRWMFETVTSRLPSEAEISELQRLLTELRDAYLADENAAKDLLSVDDVSQAGLSESEHAAWMMIASTLLNLDEVVNY
ncbi:PSD1 and planctomycete cytochrome C domain-containing protein [Stieleria sp. JC731]|uniref:PSD1 and planctomycete cytochrome C domain-containing protein n=1 Tax=Pirellulaceae TaxID=2691357 RepID=UPI001E658D93|nr:PSD1 and planctomycete cytochrome C domain-containing protein [Stieleria sp. JC731]MCC9600643.1 PSD1 and planctomycete cytochrome C domain-containing protein [Stieleria sp. JC731]